MVAQLGKNGLFFQVEVARRFMIAARLAVQPETRCAGRILRPVLRVRVGQLVSNTCIIMNTLVVRRACMKQVLVSLALGS